MPLASHARILGIAYHLPEALLTNEALAGMHPEISPRKIRKGIGVETRHVTGAQEWASDLAVAAAQKLLHTHPEAKAGIDFLLYCTQSPDYILPATACALQHRLGLPTTVGALDFNLGCSGYVYGLALAKGLIAGGLARSVLLLTADTMTKYLGGSEESANRSVFGDAATASLIVAAELPGIHEFAVGSDGAGVEHLNIRKGGLRDPSANVGHGAPDDDGRFLHMEGPEIFNFTIAAVPPLADACLKRNGLGIEDIDHVVFHQANGFMLEYLRSKIGIPLEKFHNDLTGTGNTSSSTIPIGICQRLEQGVAKPGQRALLLGFGVGFSWGATVVTL